MIMDFSLKVGFGASPLTGPLTLDDSVEQIRSEKSQVGIKTARSSVEAWPQHLTFNLQQRVQAARDFRTQEEEIYEQKNLSGSERRSKREVLKRHANIWHYDQLRLIHQAIYGDDPVRQRFMQFWWNHFTVGDTNGSNFYTGDLYWNVIGGGISGSFNELVYAVTRHPAMLTYLDNIYSVGEKSPKALNAKKNPQKKLHVGLNDNLARELLELHTVSPRCGYTEDDIRNAAKILAGWGWIFDHPNSEKMFKNAGVSDLHDAYFKDMAEPGQKSVLGVKYKSGRSDLKSLTGNLAQSEFTREFISFKLCQHFISDRPNQDDVAYVTAQWKSSKGHLPTVHRAVIERASKSKTQKFNWPITWFLTVLRVSGANLIEGWSDLWGPDLHQGEQRAHTLFTEIGQDFWSRRQPNGFSSMGIDWASPEHMERRMRLASMIFKHGKPKLSASDIIQRSNASNQTRELLEKIASPEGKFVAALCSHEVMGKIENV